MNESMNEPAPAEDQTTETPETNPRVQTSVEVKAEEPRKPFPVPCIKNWKMAMELWEQPLMVEWRLAILHRGFQLEISNQEATAQRIIFYLETADGYLSNSNFPGMRDTCLGGDSCDSEADLNDVWEASKRQRIAVKAWKVLCKYFFKNEETNPFIETPSWARIVSLTGVLEKVIWFFCVEPNADGKVGIRNVGHCEMNGINHEITRKFLRDLISFIWNFRSLYGYVRLEDEQIRERLDLAKPISIEWMDELGCLDILLQMAHRLDQKCLEALEKIALRDTWQVQAEDVRRRPNSIEEAAWFGSKAAQVVLLLRNNRVMKERSDRIVEAKMAIEEAERRFKDLQEC